MTRNTVYVVTGGNRGLGLGLVKTLLARSHTTVVASVRTDEAATGLKAENITLGEESVLHVMVLDLATAPSPDDVRTTLDQAVGDSIDRIDALINNAGMCPPLVAATHTTAADLRAAYETNAVAPLMVFQGLWPLLQKASSAPKLFMITSSVGSIGGQEPMPGGSYGPSKAALNWITRSLHLQNELQGLVAVALHPGWVQTRNGDIAAKDWNYAPGPPLTIEDSVNGMLEVIDGATRESAGGKFLTQTGQELPW
ncbi:Short-chain dehydrogenase/reductase family oxidoreductase [Paramyrothecium foliicola]|nr:Short-chain dehydrogenase/reductase family oxidoreductase [Paramyrothecium foliicola]